MNYFIDFLWEVFAVLELMPLSGWFLMAAFAAFGFSLPVIAGKWLPSNGMMRLAILLALPLVLYSAFLFIGAGWPERDDWIWFPVGLIYTSPLWIGYYVGLVSVSVIRRLPWSNTH